MDAEIKRVNSFFPASEAQLNKIDGLLNDLASVGIHTNVNKKNLSGGKEGTASSLIQHLINELSKHTAELPPTEAQLKRMVVMLHCVDIPFEEYDLTLKIYDQTDPNQWRYPTLNEFAYEIASKMKRAEVSKFLDEHEVKFFEWEKVRLKPDSPKWNFIKTLEERMSNTHRPSIVEWAIDQEGNWIRVNNKPNRMDNYNPKGFAPLQDEHLILFTNKEADAYIRLLQSDLKHISKQEEEQAISQFERKRNADGGYGWEEIRSMSASDEREIQKRREKEFKELNDLMFKLDAVAGYHDETLHASVTSVLSDDVDADINKEAKTYIKNFMLILCEDGYITFGEMADMCRDNETAIRILIGR
jgi:hypothetical protein